MNKKILLSLLFFGLCQSISFGQNAYYDGYIIKSVGDTTYGLIRYRALKSEGEFLDFKNTRKDDPIRILKNEITSFSHSNGRMFKPVNLQSIVEYESRVIVEVLVEGQLSLYKAHHGYVLRREGMTTHLSFANSDKNTMTTGVLQNVNIKKIGAFFSEGCSKPLLGGLGYRNSDRSLINLTKSFSDCQGAPYKVYGSKSEPVQINYGPIVGFNSSELIFADEITGFPDVNFENFERSNSVLFGFEINSTLNKINKNFNLTAGLYYLQKNFYGNNSRQRSISVRIDEDFIFEASYFKPVIGIGYQVIGGNFPLIISGGFIYNIRFARNSVRLRNQVSFDTITNTTTINSSTITDDEWMINTNSFGHWFGISSRFDLSDKHYLGVQFRYENGGRINILPSQTKSLQLMFSLMFKK